MLKLKSDDHASIALNGIGLIFGLLGVVGIFIQQSLTVFLPLLLPLVVCAVFCTLLINSQRNVKQTKENITPSPLRIDLIWYLDSQSWLLRGRFLFRHLLSECYGFEPPDSLLGLTFLPSWNYNYEEIGFPGAVKQGRFRRFEPRKVWTTLVSTHKTRSGLLAHVGVDRLECGHQGSGNAEHVPDGPSVQHDLDCRPNN